MGLEKGSEHEVNMEANLKWGFSKKVSAWRASRVCTGIYGNGYYKLCVRMVVD